MHLYMYSLISNFVVWCLDIVFNSNILFWFQAAGPLVMEYYPANMPGREPEPVVSVSGAGDWYEPGTGTQQKQQNDECARKASDQPEHLPSLIRVFAVCLKVLWVLALATYRMASKGLIRMLI